MATILVVDDEPSILDLLTRVLGDMGGHRIYTAECGADALHVARVQDLDLVITDVYMAGMSGLELCGRLKASPRTTGTQFILFSGDYLSTPDEATARLLGVDRVLMKPVGLQRLLAEIETVLKKGSSHADINRR